MSRRPPPAGGGAPGPEVSKNWIQRFRWSDVLWALVWPRRAHRVTPTVSGLLLIALALGLGTAAYNSSNNILFITLSLLLGCLILSGVLSWINLLGVRWRLRVSPPWRAGRPAAVALELRNGKRFLPTYGLVFQLRLRLVDEAAARPATTFSARGRDVRAALQKREQDNVSVHLPLAQRLDAGGEVRLEWAPTPLRRGWGRVELAAVGSLFPFGFLKKEIATAVRERVVIWPEPLAYRRFFGGGVRRGAGESRLAKAGSGTDLLALRRYAPGDSHRLVHWKATARTRQLLVRQSAAETAHGFRLWLQADAGTWPHPEQFELLVRLAATLAEDLFRGGELLTVAVNAGEPALVRRSHDLDAFLDQLALLQPAPPAPARWQPARSARARQNLLTFAPDGARGVLALVDGEKAAAT